jgi:GNAT superfamily N-acetyltransferase
MNILLSPAERLLTDEFLGLFVQYLESQEALGAKLRATQENAQWLCGAWREAIDADCGVAVLSVKDGEVVAFTGLMGQADQAGYWTALGTYVRPPFRRQGVASRMRAVAEKEAKALGCRGIIAGRYEDQPEPVGQGFKPLQTVWTKEI